MAKSKGWMHTPRFQQGVPDVLEGQPDKHAYPYFMVWGPSKYPAKWRHATRQRADEEALRLAERYPDCRFYVICVVGSAKTVTAKVVETPEPATEGASA